MHNFWYWFSKSQIFIWNFHSVIRVLNTTPCNLKFDWFESEEPESFHSESQQIFSFSQQFARFSEFLKQILIFFLSVAFTMTQSIVCVAKSKNPNYFSPFKRKFSFGEKWGKFHFNRKKSHVFPNKILSRKIVESEFSSTNENASFCIYIFHKTMIQLVLNFSLWRLTSRYSRSR